MPILDPIRRVLLPALPAGVPLAECKNRCEHSPTTQEVRGIVFYGNKGCQFRKQRGQTVYQVPIVDFDISVSAIAYRLSQLPGIETIFIDINGDVVDGTSEPYSPIIQTGSAAHRVSPESDSSLPFSRECPSLVSTVCI
jgi:hypothetical protein